ncbi:MAG: hypothetical protein ACREJU_00470 [Nitrospiraceae bacterium]
MKAAGVPSRAKNERNPQRNRWIAIGKRIGIGPFAGLGRYGYKTAEFAVHLGCAIRRRAALSSVEPQVAADIDPTRLVCGV